MKITRTLALGTLLLTAGIGSAFAQGKAAPRPGLTLTSPDFTDGGVIPNKFTQADPAPVSPKLDWTNVPDGTQTFVLLLHDPDVGFQKKTDDVLHWMAFNIPGTATGLAGGQSADAKMPDGTVQLDQGRESVSGCGDVAAPARC